MWSRNGYISLKFLAIVTFIILLTSEKAVSQKNILDSTFTFNAGAMKTGKALDIISRQTGFSFTYDSKLIDVDKRTEMSFHETNLRDILKGLLKNDSLVYSVIDKYIIISHAEKPADELIDTASVSKTRFITGVVIDDETHEILPYATIGLKNSGKGTVSNNNGDFGLNITPELSNDTLSVSYLGYIRREIPVKRAFGNNFTIMMKREFISIPEIIIRNHVPKDIINKARQSITRNYGSTPASMIGFYREGILKKNVLQTYSEAILQIYKSPYSTTLQNDQIKVYKSRKIENINRSDTLAIRLKAGLSTCLDLDGAKNTFDFISADGMNDYTYRITDMVTDNDDAAYAIEFKQREGVELPLYKGTIFINTTDYGILNAEFEINPDMIDKMKDKFVSTASRGFNTWPVSVKYSVSYRKINDRYFLSHVRGDLVFISKQKKRLFKSQFKVFFELAITDIDLKNVTRFERDELAPIHSVFSETITKYDPQFWGDQDFLRPEDNLQQALKNMKVRMQEFSK